MADDLQEMLNVGEQNVSLADLAGFNMDEVQEAQGSSFPGGVFQFKNDKAEIGVVPSDKGKYAIIVLGFVCEKSISYANPKDAENDSAVGRRHEERVFFAGADLKPEDTLERLGYVKKFMADTGFKASGSLQECLAKYVGHSLQAKVKQRPDKNDPDVVYANMGIGIGFWKAGPAQDAPHDRTAA